MPAIRTEYQRLDWVNKVTKLSASNLNRMEEGIEKNNALSLENAAYIDEIFAALIDQLAIGYDQGTHTFSLRIGSATGPNPTTRFNVSKQVEIHTVDEELATLISTLNSGVTVVARAVADDAGNDLRDSYGASLSLTTSFDATDGSFELTLLNKNGNALASRTFSLPPATELRAGLLSAQDKARINAISSNIASALAEAKAYADGKTARSALVEAIGEASQSLNGLMSPTDKSRLDALHALLGETADDNSVVDKINEVLAIFATYPEGASVLDALAAKVNVTDVVNSLDSNEISKPLSAYQGKVIKGILDAKVDKVDGYVAEDQLRKASSSDIAALFA